LKNAPASRWFPLLTLCVALSSPAFTQTRPETPGWIATSNNYTNLLLSVQIKHHPELGSNQGLSEYDTQIAQPTLADEDKERDETQVVLVKLKAALAQEKQKEVQQDLQIVIRRIELQFREDDFQRAREVPFLNASGAVFGGLRILLDEQTANERRAAVVARIRKYAGLESGYTPLTEIFKQRVKEQMAKPGVVYPARIEIETELGRTSSFVDGMAAFGTLEIPLHKADDDLIAPDPNSVVRRPAAESA